MRPRARASTVVAMLLALVAAMPCGTAHAADPPPGTRTEQVRFADGATSTVIQGRIKGYDAVDYVVTARAGQSLAVTLHSSNGQNYFNLTAPGADSALFIGSTSGDSFSGTLPADGNYTISVYLMRAAARRNEVAEYRLDISAPGP